MIRQWLPWLSPWLALSLLLTFTSSIPHPIGLWASLAVRHDLFPWLFLGALLSHWLEGAWRKVGAVILLGLALLVAMQAAVETHQVAGWLGVDAELRAVREPGNRTTEFWRRENGGWRLAAAVPTTLPLAEAAKLSPTHGVFLGSEPR